MRRSDVYVRVYFWYAGGEFRRIGVLGGHLTGATAKCTIDIADGKGADCALVKAKYEWILWSNSSATPRSVRFKPDDNPFTERSCWDIEPGARARSGPIVLKAAAKAYFFYASGAACDSKPSSDAKRGALKVIVQ